MFLSASSLQLAEQSTASVWSAAAIGAIALTYASYSMGVRDGKRRQVRTSGTTGVEQKTCPFSGRSVSACESPSDANPEVNAMSCPFSGRSSGSAVTRGTGAELKTYKFHVSPEHTEIIKVTLPLVAEAGTDFTKHFYRRLFKGNPELKNIFNQTNQACGHQPKRLFNLIAVAAMAAIEAGELSGDLIEAVAQKHVALGVPSGAYAIVGANILETIKDLLTTDQAVLDAWGALYGEIANIFIEREAEIYASSGWKGRRAFKLEKKVVQSGSITRFQFRPVDGLPVPAFRAGQYTTVWVKVMGNGVHGEFSEQPRHYTLAMETDVEANSTLSISVKRDGMVSKVLHDAELGTEFDLSAPFGCFDLTDSEQMWLTGVDTPVVFISAGVGCTPVLAMLENLEVDRPASWLHGAKNGREHAYRDRVRQIAATRKGDLHARVWYSHPSKADGPPGGMESCPALFNLSKYHFEGRMNLTQSFSEEEQYKFPKEMLHLENPHTQYYMCGPNRFMDAQRIALEEMGVEASRIHSEGF